MSPFSMSQTRLRAWLSVAIWSVAGVAFAFTFFLGGGVQEFPTDSGRHLVAGGVLALGFVGYWLTLWLTRHRKGTPALSDERDHQVVARANQVTLVTVLVAIFAFTIALWTAYEARGAVPVGWMWFLAYGSVILAFVTGSLATLVLDGRMGGHA